MWSLFEIYIWSIFEKYISFCGFLFEENFSWSNIFLFSVRDLKRICLVWNRGPFFCATCILHLYYYSSYCLLYCLTVQHTKTYPFSKNPLCLHLAFFFFNQNLLTIFLWDWHLAFILLSSKGNTEAFIHSEEILFVQTVK